MKPHLNAILYYNGKIYWCASKFTKGKTYFSFVLMNPITKNVSMIENSTKLSEIIIFEHDELNFKLRNEPTTKITKTWVNDKELTENQGLQIKIKEVNYAL